MSCVGFSRQQALVRSPANRPLALTIVTELVNMHLVVVMLCLALAHNGHSCGLTNISISVESEECRGCITINTTACAGLCITQEPVYKSSLAPYIQQTCNFREVAYEKVHLPGCPDGVDPFFTYPVALSCECSQCNTDSTDCGPLNIEVTGCLAH
ncbi:follitropin subunit beta [Megalops cyprinoides]|uniref:follitropin subunit beta n=1 Tax=Megalops cyprinoides TaxID=118141 RepID=UPI001863B161|nr:follitropin subunit beta [Megalops cyprinoides]